MPDFSKRLANNNVPKTEYDRQRVSVANIVRSRNDGRGPKINSSAFEKEYQDFIASLKAQKENEEVVNVTETKVEEPQVTEEAPVVENKPKKTRKKKEVVETVQEEPVVEEQTESPVYPDDGKTEGEKSDLPEFDLF